MSRFFITGLPRSRTAWFAVACSTLETPCLHEPSPLLGWDVLRTLWKAEAFGVSDSCLWPRASEIFETFAPRTLIIERDPLDVLASAIEYTRKFDPMGPERIATLRDDLFKARAELDALRSPLIKRVEFEALRDQGVVETCMDWLGVQPVLLPQLMHMRVQSDIQWNLAMLRAKAAA